MKSGALIAMHIIVLKNGDFYIDLTYNIDYINIIVSKGVDYFNISLQSAPDLLNSSFFSTSNINIPKFQGIDMANNIFNKIRPLHIPTESLGNSNLLNNNYFFFKSYSWCKYLYSKPNWCCGIILYLFISGIAVLGFSSYSESNISKKFNKFGSYVKEQYFDAIARYANNNYTVNMIFSHVQVLLTMSPSEFSRMPDSRQAFVHLFLDFYRQVLNNVITPNWINYRLENLIFRLTNYNFLRQSIQEPITMMDLLIIKYFNVANSGSFNAYIRMVMNLVGNRLIYQPIPDPLRFNWIEDEDVRDQLLEALNNIREERIRNGIFNPDDLHFYNNEFYNYANWFSFIINYLIHM